MASGQGRYRHNVWNRQEALRFQRQNAAAEKAAERERKLQETAAGKAQAEQLNADLEACVARLESILRRGLDREAAIDLNAMLRTDEFPPLDLGTDGVATLRPIRSAPPEPGPIAGFFGAKSRYEQRLAAAREEFERAELEYERDELTRQERIREQTSRYEAGLLTYQHEIARDNSRIAQISAGVPERERESVQYYLELVLAGTLLPEDVPHAAEVAYSPRGEQAVVRFELPSVDVIPGVESYTYVATTATLRKKERPVTNTPILPALEPMKLCDGIGKGC